MHQYVDSIKKIADLICKRFLVPLIHSESGKEFQNRLTFIYATKINQTKIHAV